MINDVHGGTQRPCKPILVFQSDFTYAEGAVSSMYGVVKCVDRELEIFDGTHYIPRYDIWSASYRLYQSLPFWPEGTLYVSVVDPGVGTSRRACIARTASGHMVVTPDNGTLTHVAHHLGLLEVRQIDENRNRNPHTRGTSVFDGRDVFGYTAARLASGIISWEEVGPAYDVGDVVLLDLPDPTLTNGVAHGIVDIVDPNFGNAWTNIPMGLIHDLGVSYGDALRVAVSHHDMRVLDATMPLCHAYGEVGIGELLGYSNELANFSVSLNQQSLVERTGLGFGPSWRVSVRRA